MGAQAFGRPPITGAATRINPQILELCETGRERLLQGDKEIPREELAAVCMAR